MEADFTWPSSACSGVSELWGSSRGLALVDSCYTGVQHPPEWERLAGPLRTQGALPQDSWNWQGCPTIEADFAQPSRSCSSFSGLWGLLQGAGGAGQLVHRSAAPPEGGSS